MSLNLEKNSKRPKIWKGCRKYDVYYHHFNLSILHNAHHAIYLPTVFIVTFKGHGHPFCFLFFTKCL